MTQQEINENNALIAKFCGYRTWKANSREIVAEDDLGYAGVIEAFNQFQYHKDWNKLIPVCQKVLFSIKMEIDQDPLAILGGDDERKKNLRRIRDKIENTLLSMKIENLFQVIVDGVKLINNEQTNIENSSQRKKE